MERVYNFIKRNENLSRYARKLGGILYNFEKKIIYRNRLKYVRKFNEKFIKGKPEGNIVLIVIDSLRFRNMSFTGYNRETTPFLDTFNYRLRAFSAAPHTYSSVPSILTGLYPHNHGAIVGGQIKNMDIIRNLYPLKKNIVALPEILRALGYDIIFAITIFPAILPFRNNAVIFKELDMENASKVFIETLKLIRKSLKKVRNFFAYIHLGDLHGPIRPPEKYANFFGEVKSLTNISTWDYRRPEEQVGKAFEEYKYNRILLYDNTLRYVDETLKNFILELEEFVHDPLLTMITADHGDEFWEHADIEVKYFYDPRGFYGVGHGHNLFNEVIEVPLLIKEFNSNNIKIHDKIKLISLVDLVPTILDWLNLEFNNTLFDGYSLIGEVPRDRWVLSESIAYGYEKKALIKGKYKLLYSKDDDVAWVFDLEKDPFERNPITDGDTLSFMIKKLKRIFARDLLRFKFRSTLDT